MGNAGICPDCGGKGTRWTGGETVMCRRCRGTGTLTPARDPARW